MKEQCKQAVAKALGKATLSQQEATDIENRIKDAMSALAKKDIQNWRNLSDTDKLTEAGKFVAQDIQDQLKRKHKIAALDILTQSKNLALLDHPTLPASEVVDRLVAPHGDMSGIRSIDTHYRAIAEEAKGELTDFYTNIKGGLKIFTDETLVKNIIRETFKENTGDALAKQISQQIEKVLDKNLRERFNRSGGDVGKLDKYGLPTHWDYEKINNAGFETWLKDALNNIDRSTLIRSDGQYFNEQEIISFLTEAFKTLKSGGLNKLEPGRSGFGGGAKVSNRHSESRVLHWKDADSWMEMQAKYGALPFVDLLETHINGMAKDIALVEKLGSNPYTAMKLLKNHARILDEKNGVNNKKVERSLKRTDVMFDALMGRDTSPESEVLNNIGIFYRAWNVASMLGSALISSVSDLATMRKMASMHSISSRLMFGEMIRQLNPKNAEDRKLAASLGVAVDELIGSLARWGDDGLTSVHSKSSKLAKVSGSVATQVMRATFMNAWSASSKRAFTKLMMDKYGRMSKEKSWNDLADIDRELLTKTGVDERLWKVMQVAEAVDDGHGLKLMSGRSIRKMTDEQILSATESDIQNLSDGGKRELAEKLRDEFSTQLHAHLIDEQGFAVIEAGLRERTRMFGRTTGGDPLGFFARGFLQFKSFPVAFLMRQGSRMMAQDGVKGKAQYGVSLAVAMTMLGGLSVQLAEIALGNDPQTMWDSDDHEKTGKFLARSLLKGGGLSILGDVFAAGADPSGRDFADFLTGPMGGDLKSIFGLTAGNMMQWYEGKDTNAANEAFKLAKNKIPAQNLWYTKAAINRMFFDELQDIVAPGYREKLLRKAEREQGRTRWWGDDLNDVQSPDFERVVE